MTTEKTNVAPQSTSGHFVEKAKNVINLDKVREAFFVEGPAELTTRNHTTLPIEENSLIIPQQIYNPFLKRYERSVD